MKKIISGVVSAAILAASMSSSVHAATELCRRPHIESEYRTIGWVSNYYDGIAVVFDADNKLWYMSTDENLTVGTRLNLYVDTRLTTTPADDIVTRYEVTLIPDPEDGQAMRQFNSLRWELFREEEFRMNQ